MPDLRALMQRYTVDHLAEGVKPEEFQRHIESLPGTVYSKDQNQRRFEREFYWGHDHDFGAFQMKGEMGDRHIEVIQAFMDMGVEFKGRVLDVGCWTGGTSLLLAAMGCKVTALEEVVCYAETATYLADAFGFWGQELEVIPWSLYDIPCEPADMTSDLIGKLDLALCAGVLYHVTDPVWALRIMFELLRDGGKVLIETMIHNAEDTTLAYAGPRVPGYCWLTPSPSTLRQMMEDVGFTSVEFKKTDALRGLAVGTRERFATMMWAGTPGRPLPAKD